ncbi:hypothetical protein Tco_0169887 [Tanacetum coccineum]
MASTRASISKASKRPKINIILPKQLFVDLTQDDTKTPAPKHQLSSPSAPNAASKTPSTKVPPPPLTQENASMDITLTLSPITPLDVQFNTPSPSPPIFGHPLPWNLLEAHGDSFVYRSGVGEEVWILAAKLVFTFPRKLRTSYRVPSNLYDWNEALLQPLDLSVHNLYRLFNEMKIAINLDFF